jgi:hypothetical protein
MSALNPSTALDSCAYHSPALSASALTCTNDQVAIAGLMI